MQGTNSKGKLVVISGPSGVGKSTVCKLAAERLDAYISISATTRPKGATEENGREYWFLTPEEFRSKIEHNAFLEYAQVFGNYYGTLREPIEEALRAGRTVILEIDVQGARQVKRMFSDVLTIFILPPRKEELLNRIGARGRGEDELNKRRRLEAAAAEIAVAWQHYDHLVVNDRLETAVEEVIELINDAKKGNV